MFDIVTSNNYSFFTGFEPCLIKLALFQAAPCGFFLYVIMVAFLFVSLCSSNLCARGSSNLKLCHRPISIFVSDDLNLTKRNN
jgi:hypothetical protein